MFATRAQLVQTVVDYLARDDLAPQVGIAIALFEAKASRRLALGQMEASATLTPDTNGAVTLPASFAQMRYVEALTNPVQIVASAGPEWADYQYPYVNDGWPKVYYITGLSLITRPISTYQIKIGFYAKIPGLVVDSDTNWLLSLAPDLYLYGVLTEIYALLHDDGEVEKWQSAHDRSMMEMKAQDMSGRWQGGAVRIMGQVP